MRTLLVLIMWLYFLPGLLFGGALFGMKAFEAVIAVPPGAELAGEVGEAAALGGMRVLFWLPSLYENVGRGAQSLTSWALYGSS